MQTALRVVLCAFFCYVGWLHFRHPRSFVKIVPPMLPDPLLLVYISGFFEICGGLALLFNPLLGVARWGLLALLVAVFPANVYMAVANVPLDGRHFSAWLRYGRLPLQPLMMWLVWIATERA